MTDEEALDYRWRTELSGNDYDVTCGCSECAPWAGGAAVAFGLMGMAEAIRGRAYPIVTARVPIVRCSEWCGGFTSDIGSLHKQGCPADPEQVRAGYTSALLPSVAAEPK